MQTYKKYGSTVIGAGLAYYILGYQLPVRDYVGAVLSQVPVVNQAPFVLQEASWVGVYAVAGHAISEQLSANGFL